MRIRSYTFLIGCLLVVSQTARAQNLTYLEGRVYSNEGDVAGTHVVNRTTQRATITDINGFFTIPVRLNDTLVFSAVQFKRKEIVVTESILNTEMVTVPLEEILTELEEVVVTPYDLTGTLVRDLERLTVEPVVTAAHLIF